MVSVEITSENYCSAHSYVNLSLPSGYIAGEVSSSHDRYTCDHTLYPWVIVAHRGQYINLTLYDFALDSTSGTNVLSSLADEESTCRHYGWLEDSGFDRPVRICGGERIKQIHLSRGSVVKIWTVASETGNEPRRFMIKYTGKSSLGRTDLRKL